MIRQGDIVLIPIPFTDLSSRKRRPVIVISNDAYNRAVDDIVVVALTSNPKTTDFSFSISSADLVSGKLKRPSRVRVDKIYTLSKTIVIDIFGNVSPKVLVRIRQMLADLTAVAT
jgi:mRNA interferase MazF